MRPEAAFLAARLQRIVTCIGPNQKNQPNLDLYLVRRYKICHFTIVVSYLCICQNQKNQSNLVLYLFGDQKYLYRSQPCLAVTSLSVSIMSGPMQSPRAEGEIAAEHHGDVEDEQGGTRDQRRRFQFSLVCHVGLNCGKVRTYRQSVNEPLNLVLYLVRRTKFFVSVPTLRLGRIG